MDDSLEPGRLIGELAAAADHVRERAADLLVDVGPAAVPALIAALLDESSPVDWGEPAMLLRQIGIPAFAAVRDALVAASSEEAEHRAAWTFAGFPPRQSRCMSRRCTIRPQRSAPMRRTRCNAWAAASPRRAQRWWSCSATLTNRFASGASTPSRMSLRTLAA